MAFSDTLNKGIQMQVMGVPVGRGVYMAAGRGISQTIFGLLERFGLPPVATAAGGAWAVQNVDAVKRTLGQVGALDLSSVMVMEGINSQFDLTGIIQNLLSDVEGYIPGVGGGGETSGVRPVGAAPSAPAAPATSYSAAPARSVGQMTAEDQSEGAELYDDYMESLQD